MTIYRIVTINNELLNARRNNLENRIYINEMMIKDMYKNIA